MKLSGEKKSYASGVDSSRLAMWGKREEKDQQKAEKHKLNEGGKAAFERCKRKCECIRKPPIIKERHQTSKIQKPKNKLHSLKERDRD